MRQLLVDFRYAIRTLVRNRLISSLALVAFALGIGVTTAVFSIFNGVLLKPLPYPHSEQLVVVFDTQPACASCPASFPKYNDWRERNRVFSAIAGVNGVPAVVTGAGEPERVLKARATASFVEVFQIPPMFGRWFTPEEDRDGGGKVVVLSHDFWSKRFNGDRQVLGRTLLLDGQPHEIIGVMPAGFRFLNNAPVFVPLAMKLDPSQRGSHFLPTYARLKPGVTLERAATEMRALGVTLAHEFHHNHGVDVRSYYETTVGSIRASLQILLGAVFLVLLIACANVANLLLASGLARRRELAIRVALGAGQRHLARQLTAESVLLALTGGALGILLATWIVRTFIVLAGNQLPRATSISMDGTVLAFAVGLSLLVGIFCGLWPLITLRTRELTSAIREGDTRTVSGAGQKFGNGLVVAEIAIAFALLVGAGLLVKNLIRLQERDSGMRVARIVAFDLLASGPRYAADEQVQAFYRDLYARLASIGGVEKAGMISHLPMHSYGWNGEMSVEGGSPWSANEAPVVEYRWIQGDYFQTMGVPLVKGRLLDARDRAGTLAVNINQAMAAKFWRGKDPIGRRFGQGDDVSKWYQVVGVVGDVRSVGLAERAPYEFYRTIEQASFPSMTVVLRSSVDDPLSLMPSVRQIVHAVDPALPITEIQTMEQVVSESVGQPRLMSALTGMFGALAGLLAIVGVYGVMAYNVRRQRREFGIRVALGASAAQVRTLVIGRGLVLAALGVAIGAAAAWFLTGLLRALLNDVTPTDPWIFAGTAGAVLMVSVLASYLPARSASRVDPIVVLRD